MTVPADAPQGGSTTPVDVDAVRRAQERLATQLGEDPTLRDVADDLGCSPAVVLSLLASQSAERWGAGGA